MTGRALDEKFALNARLPRGEEGWWRIILTLDAEGPWTVPMVDGETNTRRSCVGKYVRRLVKAGYARVVSAAVEHNRPQAKQYRLLKTQKQAPRIRPDGSIIQSSQQECMWRAMRSLRSGFTVRELAFAASMPGQEVKESAARRYVEWLARAGYLVLVRPRAGRLDLNVWRLKPAMNTGPLSPTLLRVDGIYDRNLRRLMGEEYEAREVAP